MTTDGSGPAPRRAAVLGRPVGHSLSPALHNAGYAAAGLTGWRYDAHDVGEAELAGFVAGLGPEWAGLSLTMPLKRVVLEVADEVGPLAGRLGAANTLVSRPSGWWADNTDGPGLLDALRDAGVAETGRVAVLGTGGTARAALYAASALPAADVVVHARRTPADLLAVAERLAVPVRVAAFDAADEIAAADVVISTVPAGAADELAARVAWRPGQTVFDVLYEPWPTGLAAAAAAGGATVIGGLELLVAQAVRQFELFTGVPAPAAAMRAALSAGRDAPAASR